LGAWEFVTRRIDARRGLRLGLITAYASSDAEYHEINIEMELFNPGPYEEVVLGFWLDEPDFMADYFFPAFAADLDFGLRIWDGKARRTAKPQDAFPVRPGERALRGVNLKIRRADIEGPPPTVRLAVQTSRGFKYARVDLPYVPADALRGIP